MQLGTNRINGEKIEIHSEVLARHAAMLGSTGSGKTVMAKALIEECTIDEIPSLIIDPQGDLARLWDDYDYLWFPVINPNQDSMFYEKMGKKIPQSRFVKVIKREKHIELHPADMF